MGKTNVLIVFGPGMRKPRTGYSQSAATPSVRSLVRPRISIYCQVLTVAPDLALATMSCQRLALSSSTTHSGDGKLAVKPQQVQEFVTRVEKRT